MVRTFGGTKRNGPRQLTQKTVKYKPTRMLPAMPLDVWFKPWKAPVTLAMNGNEAVLEFGQVARPVAGAENLAVHEIRDTFLGLRNPMEALSFFELAGPFRSLIQFGHEADASRITWTEVLHWQEVFRRIMQFGWLRHAYTETSARYDLPHDLLEIVENVSVSEASRLGGLPPDVAITTSHSSKDGRPELSASIFADSVLEAIAASLYVDTLNGVRYRLCALPDCRKLYEVTSGHEREYCEKAHAHLASVRRRRAEAKQEQAKSRAPAAIRMPAKANPARINKP